MDVTQTSRVQTALVLALERFGAIHGVIHTAGNPGAGLVQLKIPAAAAAVLAPKVHGTVALAQSIEGLRSTRGLSPDFLLLFGSNAGVTGGFGQVDTCAASAFLDAFAQSQAGTEASPFVQTLDWGYFHWQPIVASDPVLAEQLRAALESLGIGSEELGEVVERALSTPLPQIVVATRDLAAMMAQLDTFDASSLGGGPVAVNAGGGHPRPDLATPYVAPRDGIETTIAEIWQGAFGIQGLGVDDNFFDLSGNSLLAIQIVTRVSAAFEVELTIASLLESPTIAELAQRVVPLLPGASQQNEEIDMDRILREIEGLSPEEAEERLARELGGVLSTEVER